MAKLDGNKYMIGWSCRTIVAGVAAVLFLLVSSTLRPAPSFAAVTATVLTTGSSDANPPYTTASITPQPNSLILAFISNHEPDSPGNPALAGNGLTWVQVATVLWRGVETPDDRISVFRAMGPSPTPGSVTITFPAAPATEHNCLWTIVQFEGVIMTGVNGSGAVVQTVTQKSETGTSMIINLAPPLSRADNASVGFFGQEGDKFITPGAGYDSAAWIKQGGPNRVHRVQWKIPGSTTVNATFGDNKPNAGIALEIGEGPTVTLGDGTDPPHAAIPPGGAATMADAFTLQTNFGTVDITDMTVTLASGSYGGIALVEITDDTGTSLGSVSPTSDTPKVTLSSPITVTTTLASYKIRITAKSHLNMPAPSGSTYSVTAFISNWTGGNSRTVADNGGTTITIDNQSPGNVTGTNLSFSLAQASLGWTNPGDADLGKIVVLRRQGAAVADAPAEGATYSLGNVVGNSVVACVVTSPETSCTDNGSATGTDFVYGTTYYYKAFTRDTNGNYSAGGVGVGGGFVPHNYQPDAMIKVRDEPEGTYLTPNVYESTATTQVMPQGVVSGSTAVYRVRFKNNASNTDSIKVTGTPSGSNFAITYKDEASAIQTAAVTGAGYTIPDLAVGGYKEWTIEVTPAGGGVVRGGTSYNVSVTATSVTDGTKTDQVKAATTSTSANLTLLQSADRASYQPGEDITYTTVGSNGVSLTNAKLVVVTETVPGHTGFRIGSAAFNAGSSTLSSEVTYSNGSYGYTPVSGGCGAPAGYDYCVTQIKWTMTGEMPPATNFTCNFVVGVK